MRVDADRVTLAVHCSAGFYVRALAHDLGERLGVGAHLAALRRTRAGDFGVEDALPLDAAEQDPDRARAAVIPLAAMLPRLPSVALSSEAVRRAMNGGEVDRPPSLVPDTDSLVRLLDPAGDLVAIARPSARPGFLHPAVVLR